MTDLERINSVYGTNYKTVLEAIKGEGFVFKYTISPSDETLECAKTDDISLKLVTHCKLVLSLVEEQTHEICMAAVKDNGLALEFVKEQTPEIVEEAIKQCTDALKFVRI